VLTALTFAVNALADEPKPRSKGTLDLVGTLIAVDEKGPTIVVDVPLAKSPLRVGARLTKRSILTSQGTRIALGALKPGQKLHIIVRPVADGDELISADVLAPVRRSVPPKAPSA
jgi:hypothetical protein